MKRIHNLHWLAAITAIGTSPLLISHANGGESLDRLGRLLGFGWSDGYHACSQDGFHLGENLPPRSYAADHALYAVSDRHAGHSYPAQASAPCTDCNEHHRSTNVNGLDSLNGPMYGAVEETYSQPQRFETPEASTSIVNPPVMPAERNPDLMNDAKDDSLDVENPASPSDQLRASDKVAPAKPLSRPAQKTPSPAIPSRPPQPTPALPQPAVPAPMPDESDDDLLLDLPDDSDGLIDELPPPARDPLSPENSTYRLHKSRRGVTPVAQTSAVVPLSKPTRIGSRDPQRLPSVR